MTSLLRPESKKGRIFLRPLGSSDPFVIPSGRVPSPGLGAGGLLGLQGDHGLDHVTKSLSRGPLPQSAALLQGFDKTVDRKVTGKPAKRRGIWYSHNLEEFLLTSATSVSL
jgi:hypothetical protein